MSKVWTRKARHHSLHDLAVELIARAKGRKSFSHRDLPWVAECPETQKFIEFWFAEPQRSNVARLAWEIELLRRKKHYRAADALRLALSKIIVTKHAGASLAWDVSHSRPHRVRSENDFDVYNGFYRAVTRLINLLESEPLPVSGRVSRGDCRNLSSIEDGTIDAVITSPPYLNAIDYMRGHKLALVWFGYTIPSLRDIRGAAVGTERVGAVRAPQDIARLENAVRSIRRLPGRQRAIVHKYAYDAEQFLCEMRRILEPNGLLVLVLGDSNLRGVPVYNSRIFKHFASENGFILDSERKRQLASNRRYLPISGTNSALEKRMTFEVLQAYRAPSNV